MRPEDYENLYRIEDTFWWFRGMRRIHERLIGPQPARSRTLLDAGCGTGANIEHFRTLGIRVFAVDYSPDAMPWLRRRGLDGVARASITALPFAEATFDIVTSFDVLCQLPAEAVRSGLAEALRVLKPDGFLLVRVPAYQWLWSSSDASILSVHRFNRPELIALLREAGFEVSFASYANTLLFPVALVWRLLKRSGVGGGTDVRPLPTGFRWLNSLFCGILGSEARWLGWGFRFPLGLSVIARVRKPH